MEPLSQALEDDQEIIGRVDFTEDIITEEAPAADMELNQDSIRSDDTTAVKVQETITEQMGTPAEDMELSQDGNTKRTSFGTHINVPTSDKKDHPERQAEEKTEEVETSQAEEVL